MFSFDNKIQARNANQKALMTSLFHNTITVATGHPGTGKTLLSLFYGLKSLQEGRIKNIYYVRNEVKVDLGCKSRGALPGTLEEKSAHLLLPLADNLNKILPEQIWKRYIGKEIKFVYAEDLRGRSLSDCFIISDETQNLPPAGVKTLLTRLDQNASIALIGDSGQKDLKKSYDDGLSDAVKRLRGMPNFGIIYFNDPGEIQRSPVVSEVVKRYLDIV